MGKNLYIAEKPSVAQEFAKALKEGMSRGDGYLEGNNSIVTWCVGHLVTMSYPDAYDPALKRWDISTLPFLPKQFIYEIIPSVKKQFDIVSNLLNRADVDCIYVCTDSGREGEYIYRLVDQMAKVPAEKQRRRVWIDSQTEEEILRGIREAKPLTEYNNLSDSAYLRAKEDYLMGINFSRILTIKYGFTISQFLKLDKRSAISVGRVMTCVLGMVVRREREIRAFVKTPFYRIIGDFALSENASFSGEWRAVEGSRYFESPLLYKENGFRKREDAETCIDTLKQSATVATILNIEKKKEKKSSNKMTLRQACKMYIDKGRPFLSADTLNSYESMAGYAFQSIMDIPIEDLTQEIMEQAVKDEMQILVHGKPISAKTIKNRWGLISATLRAQGMHFDLRLPKVHRKNRLLPEPQEVIKLASERNFNLVEAYKILNFDKRKQSDDEAVRQRAINEVKGKAHLTPMNGVATADNLVEIPNEQKSLWRTMFPDKSASELKKLYNNSLQ